MLLSLIFIADICHREGDASHMNMVYNTPCKSSCYQNLIHDNNDGRGELWKTINELLSLSNKTIPSCTTSETFQ